MHIGPYHLPTPLLLAPMAGVSDRPFRAICRRFGAALTVSEMVSANPLLRDSVKSRRRLDHAGEPAPRAVQIAGADPAEMADFARYNVDRGAQIIDINMGCPAKKVCGRQAGSALLRDEVLVGRILEAVTAAVEVPVTLKIRTGWDPAHRNGVTIARIAERAGIRALTVHGRTRACGFTGHAEYDTIAAIKAAVTISVIANGDIDGPEKAQRVLRHTGADAVMIGRAAQGNPWIFTDIAHYLRTGRRTPAPDPDVVASILIDHLHAMHDFYGGRDGVRFGRKHLGWYARRLPGGASLWRSVSRVDDPAAQLAMIEDWRQHLCGACAA